MKTSTFRNALLTLVCQSGLFGLGTCEQVPETLDLARSARFALNALTGTTDQRGEFMFRCSIAPPSVAHDAYSFSACGPKYIESMAMTSLMTGQSLDESRARVAVNYLISCLGEDGLFYCRIGPDRPWDTSSPEDWANMYGQGRMLRAMLAMHQLEGGQQWGNRMNRLVHTLKQIVIRKTDSSTGETYAYYPTTPGYGDIFSYPKSGWKTTELLTAADASEIGKSIADMPDHSFGIPLYLGGMIEPLTRYAISYNDPETLELAGQLVRFVMKKESSWMPDGHAQGVIPEQNGQFYGHFHGHTLALRGILEYGIATNDPQLKNFARAGYEYARTFGIGRLGWFQEYTGKHSHETCGLVNMTALAIKLSRAGVGDYWDDVDGYVRNHLTESQFVDVDSFYRANQNRKLSGEQKAILKRLVGTFAGWGSPESLEDSRIMNCCTANGSQGLYYVWDGILEHRDGTITVNLLLNRRSPWVNVASSLPYRGEVRLQNKSAGRIVVRIPNWVDKSRLEIRIAGEEIQPDWLQNYLLIDNLKPQDEIVIRFPMEESVERYAIDSYEFRGTKYLGRHQYTIAFRGNTAIGITPAAQGGYATYNRAYFKSRVVPQTEVADYTATKQIAW
jgi:hypothetical protein